MQISSWGWLGFVLPNALGVRCGEKRPDRLPKGLVSTRLPGEPDFITIGHPKADQAIHDREREYSLLSYVVPATEPQIQFRITVGIVFGNVAAVYGKLITSTLNAQASLVKGIVELFGTTFE